MELYDTNHDGFLDAAELEKVPGLRAVLKEVDTNGDGTNNDRPLKGRDDATLPILSAVDSRGYAVRNGIQGQPKLILDGRLQYLFRVQKYQAGLFLELYNLTNHVNFGDPTGARNSANFMIPVVSDDMRTAQLGVRLTF
jgi:hypothetical protein